MPNICVNELTVTGPQEEINRFLNAAKGWVPDHDGGSAFTETPFSLNALFPIPTGLNYPHPVDLMSCEENWYTWCWENWGTKWDVIGASVERRAEREAFIRFKSAWNSPAAAFTQKIALDFQKLTFVLYFEDPGTDAKVEYEWKEGTLVRDGQR